MSRRELTKEERRLWREATKHDKKVKHEPAEEMAPEQASVRRVSAAAVKTPSIPAKAKKATPTLAPLLPKDAKRLFSSKVEATLDLHGLSREEAYEKLTKFLERGRKQGKRHLLIITGKGKGILKTSLPLWLDAPKFRAEISAIAPGLPEKGGDGALHVLLKKLKI
jgi:DNA-nicking Smr family endonuclease